MTDEGIIYNKDPDIIYSDQHIEHIEHIDHHVVNYKNNTGDSPNIDYIFFNLLFNVLLCGLCVQLSKNCYDKIKRHQTETNLRIYNQRLLNSTNVDDIANDYNHVKIIIETDFDNELCSICLENLYTVKEADEEDQENKTYIETNKDIIQIKCKHMFHKKCLDPWIILNKNCPLCKRIV